MTHLTRRTLALGLIASPIALATAAKAATTHTVNIQGMAFQPASLTIQTGDTVKWTNVDRPRHTATARDRAWSTATLQTNQSGSITFNSSGTENYFCKIHPGMTGKIIVQ